MSLSLSLFKTVWWYWILEENNVKCIYKQSVKYHCIKHKVCVLVKLKLQTCETQKLNQHCNISKNLWLVKSYITDRGVWAKKV